MGESNRNLWYHVMALAIVIVWGTTFVSTKLLLFSGLTPETIFFYRFVLAYIGIWFFARGKLLASNWRDEGKMALLGITGGSLYFLAENQALQYTLASNVALLLCTAPILTAVVNRMVYRNETLSGKMLYGSLIAFAGVCLVVFNGSFVLRMNPLGDILCFVAALSWAFYTVILKDLSTRYDSAMITRKIFFYGIITILPIFILRPLNTDREILLQPLVWGNILYLGVVASLLCFLFWNVAVKRLGAVRTTNYVYFAPPVTLVASAMIIDEPVKWIAVAGAALIIFGVYRAEKACKEENCQDFIPRRGAR